MPPARRAQAAKRAPKTPTGKKQQRRQKKPDHARVSAADVAVIHFLRHEEHQKVETVALRLGLNTKTVSRALKKNPLQPQAPAAKRKESAATKLRRDTVLRLAKQKRVVKNKKTKANEVVGRKFSSLGALTAELRRLGFSASKNSTHRDAKARGIQARVRPVVGKKTRGTPLATQRVAAAKTFLETPLARFLFCDETWVNTNDRGSRTEQVPPNEQPTEREATKHPPFKLMVWALVGVGFKGPLIFFEDANQNAQPANQQSYKDLCGRRVRAALNANKANSLFVQDNARPHLLLGRELRDEGFNVATWPPYSPDLNPIETIWSTLHRRISEFYPRTAEELKGAALLAWDKITQAEIDAHCAGFFQKLTKCIKTGGARVKN
jgi:transposase